MSKTTLNSKDYVFNGSEFWIITEEFTDKRFYNCLISNYMR